MVYNFLKSEEKWQKAWEKDKVHCVKQNRKKKYYVLEMYPYPSASGLHMGHAFNYTIGDIKSRYMRMKGFNVLHPMGFDSFGLPAENAAIKAKSHPRKFTDEAIVNFVKQQKALGLSYDWERRLQSHDEGYYKWNQWFFIQLYKKGLVYRKKSPVNYCPKCDSVLANEQVHNGRCWRHMDVEVQTKHLEQWFLKTTAYAEELLNDIENLDWPERIKTMQKNWIGKSEGCEIIFEINEEKWPIFTTRADTLFGVTFLVISAQHPRLMELVTKERKKEVENLLKKIKSTKQEDIDQLEKEGAFTGSYAIHPLTKEKVPVYAGNFVLAEYGCGMVMAVPAHDSRDYEFAKKYNIPIKLVIQHPESKIDVKKMKEAYTAGGILINSGDFNGLFSDEGKEHIIKALEVKKKGKKTTQYKLRDWLVSRQRYWGTPIPMCYDEEGKVYPIEEKDLPVKLPNDVEFGKGNPLKSSKIFKSFKKDGKIFFRETDTMDTFFDSSWYYMRFTDSSNKDKPFDKSSVNYWMPVDFYTGGAEHACMHLIYARFFTKALRDMGLINFNEPFIKLFNQGMIHGEDGVVMSKSRGNVVDPLEISRKYSADSLRMFLVSMSSPDKDSIWNGSGLESVHKFLVKLSYYLEEVSFGKSDEKVESKVNKAIRGIGNDIENLNYNLAIIKLRELFDYLNGKEISKKDFENCLKILAPFCPHIADEFWSKNGGKGYIIDSSWPEYDENKINEKYEQIEKAVDKTVSDIVSVLKLIKEKQGKDGERVYLYVIPNEKEFYIDSELTKRVGKNVKVYSVNDKDKYDPDGKSGKTKPGKPGIYIE